MAGDWLIDAQWFMLSQALGCFSDFWPWFYSPNIVVSIDDNIMNMLRAGLLPMVCWRATLLYNVKRETWFSWQNIQVQNMEIAAVKIATVENINLVDSFWAMQLVKNTY